MTHEWLKNWPVTQADLTKPREPIPGLQQNSPEFIDRINKEFGIAFPHEIELTPTTQLIFECCKCGIIHDPETISFQTLIDTGKAIGWTIKFRDAGYDAYCKDHLP